jgi:hypothetical protein
MKKIQFIGLSVLLLIFGLTLVGCPTNSDGNDIWLDDVKNPFLGSWKSAPDDDGIILTFTGKTDGSFAYVMSGEIPPAYDSVKSGTGAYLVRNNTMVAYFPFGLKAYQFEALDNDTIKVTEKEYVAEGEGIVVKLGVTNTFTHVAGTDINKDDRPFAVSYSCVGEWHIEDNIALDPINYPDVLTFISNTYDMKSDGTFYFEAVMGDLYSGSGTAAYCVYGGNTLVIYEDDDEGFEESTFVVKDNGNTFEITGVGGQIITLYKVE